VLTAARNVFKALKPGVSWVYMHKLAERTILSGLKDLGCLNGDVYEMQKQRIGFIFMPTFLATLLD
jgi:Xaa-Pro dipeptidase